MVRRKVLITGVALVGLVAVGLSAYAFRARLGDVPVVGAWLSAAGGSGMDSHAAMAGSPGEMPADRPAPGTARAEVVIDPRRQQLIGVRTVPAERRAMTRTTRAVGIVEYDETRLVDVNVRVEGWVEELYVDYTGRFVERGEPLFALYSPELVATQSEYLLALTTRDQLRQSQIADAREYADRLVQAAQQRLEFWNLPADQLEALDETRQAQRTMVFRSPAGGVVIEKQVVRGQRLSPGMSVYRLADLSRIWIEAEVYEQEIGTVRTGLQAVVTIEAYPGEQFPGRIVHVSPYLDQRTRTGRVRLELANPGGRLKPGMYAHVSLDTPLGAGIVVPANAVLDSGPQQQFVFVAQGDGFFEPRRVTVGQRLHDAVQILEGVGEGELVATNATFFIDSESQLRAALQGFEPLPAMAAPAAPGERLAITFRSQPDPPRTGGNTFEVEVRDPAGRPVTDAEVSVVFFMAAMPTMNMPAMQTETSLEHAGGGTYRGTGQVLMGGRWDVTVTVSRDGERIGRQQLGVIAR
jgi:RND family efflux transporter MFP subunit